MILAVVVLYQPDHELLRTQLEATRPQVDGIVYYDNGAGRAALAAIGALDAPGVRCVGDGNNCGLAEALNRALEAAREAAFVLLLDQDSVPAPDMVAVLRAGHGPGVAAVGPSLFDALEGRVERFGQAVSLLDRPVRKDGRTFPVYYLITSGTLVESKALAEIGPMESSLFIDAIDFEWCYRARARGYRILGTYGTQLRHHRGEHLLRPLPGITVRVHSAQRLFYMYRNHVRLCFRGYMSLVWKVRGAKDLFWRLVGYALFVPERRRHLGAIARGIAEGWRLGRADQGARVPTR
jgi:rhamnosyltransferase